MNFYKYWFASRLIKGNEFYKREIDAKKKELFSNIKGTVLEIGPGAGDNIPYYPKNIEWVGLEPNIYLHQTLYRRLKEHSLHGKIVTGSVEDIPFYKNTFSVVVSTLVICSVRSDERSLSEIYRVLKKNGKYIFIEHIRSSVPWYASIQDSITPLWMVLADGCKPNKDVKQVFDASMFRSVFTTTFTVPLPVVAPHIMGIAVK